MSMKCKVIPLPGETVVAEIEGELWAQSSNPIVRIIWFIIRIICFLFGFRKAGYMLVTSQRVIFFKKSCLLWCFPTKTENYSLLPQAIANVGYTREATCCWCLCPCYMLFITQISGEIISVQLKGANETEAATYVNAIFASIKR